MDIGKGDWVLCVDADPLPGMFFWPEDCLDEGAVYFVLGLISPDLVGGVSLVLDGKPRARSSIEHGGQVGYRAARFRPLKKPPEQADKRHATTKQGEPA